MNSHISTITETVLPVLLRHGVSKAGLFGSVVRDDFNSTTSDIDILIELQQKKSFLNTIGIKHDLEDALAKKVDLVEYHLLKPSIRDRVLSQEVRIL